MINIDFNYMITVLTPPVQRTVEVIAGIKAKFTPLETVKADFYAFFNKIEYEMIWNGQVCMLEELLNLEFDEIDKSIFISNANNIEKQFVFNTAEANEPTYVFNTIEVADPLYLRNDIESAQYHFIVNIPAAVTFNEAQLKFFVNKYKLAGKRWKIVII